jgi:hypothetical protein
MGRYHILKHQPSPEPESVREQQRRLDTIEKFLTEQPTETLVDIGRILANNEAFLKAADMQLFIKIRNIYGGK